MFSSNAKTREVAMGNPLQPFLLGCGVHYPTHQPTEGALMLTHLAIQTPGHTETVATRVFPGSQGTHWGGGGCFSQILAHLPMEEVRRWEQHQGAWLGCGLEPHNNDMVTGSSTRTSLQLSPALDTEETQKYQTRPLCQRSLLSGNKT